MIGMSYNNPVISVVIPAYHSENTIGRAISSIMTQTYANWELLVITEEGDNSNTVNVIKDYALKDSRIKLIVNTHNKGIPGSLNCGIEQARGKYIARMDADDESLPERFQIQVDYMESHPEIGLCGTDMNMVNDVKKSNVSMPHSSDEIKARTPFSCPLSHPTVMFRRQLFANNGWWYDETKDAAEDYDLWLRLWNRCDMSNIPSPLIDYHYDNIHNASARVNTNAKVYDILKKFWTDEFGIIEIPKTINGYIELGDISQNTVIDEYICLNKIEHIWRKREYSGLIALYSEVQRVWNKFLEKSGIMHSLNKYMVNQLVLDEEFKDIPIDEALGYQMNISPNSVEGHIKSMEIENRLAKQAVKINNVIIYGLGTIFFRNKTYINNYANIIQVADKNMDDQVVDGYQVKGPSELRWKAADAILITSTKYYEEIHNELVNEHHIPEEKILPLGILNFKNL